MLLAALVVTIGEEVGRGAVRHHRRHPPAVTAAGASGASQSRAHVSTPSRLDAAAQRAISRLLALRQPIYCGGRRGNEVAFTFDDGPGPYTHLALRKLAQARERATFFVVGRNIPLYPGYLRRELRLASIGDHTYTHPELTALSPQAVYTEIARTARAIQAASGERPRLFRPPYELHDATVDRIARQLGLLEILWDVDSGDSLGADWAQIIRTVETRAKPGSIVLMHENRGQTIRALTTLLPWLHRHHLRSVSVPQLLASDPPSSTQVRSGLRGCGISSGPARRPAGG